MLDSSFSLKIKACAHLSPNFHLYCYFVYETRTHIAQADLKLRL